MANTRIGRTVSSAGSRRKATFSAWVKRTGLGESWMARFGGTYSESDFMQIGFNSTDNCFIVGTGSTPRMECTRRFRDTNAWYHYLVAFDTEQSTASNRLKFYINGEQITSFGTATYPTLNQDLHFNKTGQNNAWLGGRGESSYEFNGLMSHVHWCDGYAYTPSSFGSTDTATGEWKINTNPSVSYGTNGYFMLKDGNSLTDASGNGNNFSSLVGTLTKTEDNPSNVFATFNPLWGTAGKTFTNGNTSYSYANNYQRSSLFTLFSQSKFYLEWKNNSSTAVFHFNLVNEQLANDGRFGLDTSNNDSYRLNDSSDALTFVHAGNTDGVVNINGSAVSATDLIRISTSDVAMMAFDPATGKLWLGKNGTWDKSGDPANGNNPIYTWSSGNYTVGDPIYGGFGNEGGSRVDVNFGNGYFGTTAVSSAGTNASGNGIFEYDVPTGYTALSTKGLNL